MRFLFAVVFLVLGATITLAQEPAPAPADASVQQLIDILENDTSRAALIEKLKQAGSVSGAEAAGETPETPELSIVRQLAEYTKAAAEGTSATLRNLGTLATDFQRGLGSVLAGDLTLLWTVLLGLVMVGIGLFGGFLVLRLLIAGLQGLIAAKVVGRSIWTRLLGILGATVIDIGSVFLAWGLGYVVALQVVGDTRGQMGINQSLLLNAFLVVELVKLVVRVFLAPRQAPLRLLPVGDDNAAYWQFWLARIISLVGYTFLFLAPMLAGTVAPAAASALQVLVMATAVTIGIIIVLQNKHDVRTWLTGLAARQTGAFDQLLLLLARTWHVLAITYLIAILVVWFANPEQALPFMLGATVQSLIAILAGTVIAGFISRFVSVGLALPDDVKRRLPLLQERLYAFVPGVMMVVRWVVIAGVLAAIIQAWALFNVVEWLGSDAGLQMVGSVISAALIILVCIALHVVVASWVEYRLNTSIGKVPTAREKTLLSLFKNAFTVALVVFGLMLALAQIGVNIAPLLAGAGVIGLAIGFGAQKLVQDIITGIFIQFENVMNEGDVVEAAGKAGVVEKLTIRSVTIRDMSGTVHLIPFSSVDQVSNMARGFSFYVSEVEVAYDNDIDAVKQAMRDAFAVVMANEDYRSVILDDLDLQGLIAITPPSMRLRSRIKTLAGKQWGAGRYYSEVLMRLFAERGIETPTPRVRYVTGGPAP